MAATEERFADFEPLFGEAKAEWGRGAGDGRAQPLRPFIFCARAIERSHFRIVAADCHSLAFDRVLTVQDLEDFRDDVGIGGSWSDFFDYLVASLSSDDVKLVLDAPGVTHAQLVAHKSKGLPRISLSLNRLMNSSANDAMADLSLALFRSLKSTKNKVAKEQEQASQLARSLSSERERNKNLQKQLDAYSFSSKRKIQKSKASDNALPVSIALSISDASLASAAQQPSADGPSDKDPQPVKAIQRPAFASRRDYSANVDARELIILDLKGQTGKMLLCKLQFLLQKLRLGSHVI